MKMCKACLATHKKNGWYLSSSDKQTKLVAKCEAHPVITNWRVIRTLQSIRHWDRKSVGYVHPMSRGMLVDSAGVSRVVAEKILFDYEKPFLDLLITDGYIKDSDGLLSITPKANEIKELIPEEAA